VIVPDLFWPLRKSFEFLVSVRRREHQEMQPRLVDMAASHYQAIRVSTKLEMTSDPSTAAQQENGL
jgi:hypothetical protein